MMQSGAMNCCPLSLLHLPLSPPPPLIPFSSPPPLPPLSSLTVKLQCNTPPVPSDVHWVFGCWCRRLQFEHSQHHCCRVRSHWPGHSLRGRVFISHPPNLTIQQAVERQQKTLARSVCTHGEDGSRGRDLRFYISSQSRHWDSRRRHIASYAEGVPADDGVPREGT